MSPVVAGSPPAALSRPWLLADIGGTNARFGWLDDGSDAILHVDTLPTAAHAGPVEAARVYLDRVQQRLGPGWRPPVAGAFAVATVAGADRIVFTNSGWAFSTEATRRALGLDTLLVPNDFEALALSLPGLGATQVRRWPAAGVATGAAADAPAAAAGDPPSPSVPEPEPMRHATRAVIGPGTGLGVAGLVHTARGWVALPGEGGHATLAAADDFDAALIAAARRRHAHVSAERLLSGIGLPVLHAAVADVLGQAAPALATSEIVGRGLSQADPVCSRTLDAFCALLGSFSGNVALVMGARGGVYIGGGIVPRLGDRFFASAFRERFEAKGRFQAYLQSIPTVLIVDTLAALVGAARALAQHRS